MFMKIPLVKNKIRIYNFVTKKYPKRVTLRSFFKIIKNVKKMKNLHGFWRIRRLIENNKKDTSPAYLWNNYYFLALS